MKKKPLGKLHYPTDLWTSSNDYMMFTHAPYLVNDTLYGRKPGNGRFTAQNNAVYMYMPNSTPATNNAQGWKGQAFQGELGQLSKMLLDFMGSGDNFAGSTGRNAGGQRGFNAFEAAQQQFLNKAAGELGSDAATALQLGKGQVYNPNVEMLYKMPTLRKFRFDFDFIPKSAQETTVVDQIIREFKYWSSPGLDDKGKFLQVPHIWDIKYMDATTNKNFKRLNKFKYCVLEAVVVAENPKSNYHITIDDRNGSAPVHTSLSLQFQETDIIVRQDYDKAYKTEGYQRGY